MHVHLREPTDVVVAHSKDGEKEIYRHGYGVLLKTQPDRVAQERERKQEIETKKQMTN